MPKMRLSDIAESLGVSTATVSNALNRKNGVSPEKAEQIRAAAARMGYFQTRQSEKRSIRFLIYKKHGKVVMDTAFFAQLIEGVQEKCQMAQCDLLINNVRIGDDFAHYDDMPILLLATEMGKEELKPFESFEHPVLLLDSDFRYERFNSVSIDNCEAGYVGARALMEKGHRKIGFLDSSLPFNNMKDRYKGFCDALAEEGLEPFVKIALEPTVEGAYADMCAWLEAGQELPSAFFAGNDIMAIGVMRALKRAQIDVPGRVSIVGMDDMPMCQVVEPALSTVHVDKQRLGRMGVSMLLTLNKAQSAEVERVRMGVSFVGRESVRDIRA